MNPYLRAKVKNERIRKRKFMKKYLVILNL